VNVQEILAQIDHAITEIDLVLHQWQEDLDMMSFIAYDASFELWTSDIPPRLVTSDVLSQAAGKELRVMHFLDGRRLQIGTATINQDGTMIARIDKDVPELRTKTHFSLGHRGEFLPIGKEDLSLEHIKAAVNYHMQANPNPIPYIPRKPYGQHGPLAHFEIHLDGSVWDNRNHTQVVPPRERFRGYKTNMVVVDEALENHPFFKNQEGN